MGPYVQTIFSLGIGYGAWWQWWRCLGHQLLSHWQVCETSLASLECVEAHGVTKYYVSRLVYLKSEVECKLKMEWRVPSIQTFVWSSLAFISTEIFHTLQDLFQGIYAPYFELFEVILWAFLFLQWRNKILVIITRHINWSGLKIFFSVSLSGDVVWIIFYVLLFLPNF